MQIPHWSHLRLDSERFRPLHYLFDSDITLRDSGLSYTSNPNATGGILLTALCHSVPYQIVDPTDGIRYEVRFYPLVGRRLPSSAAAEPRIDVFRYCPSDGCFHGALLIFRTSLHKAMSAKACRPSSIISIIYAVRSDSAFVRSMLACH